MAEIEAIVELTLVYPYGLSTATVVELVKTWGFKIINLNTNSNKAVISIPRAKFKTMFNTNPKKGEFSVPSGAESFIEAVLVKEVVVK